jgi:ribonuclease HI
MKRRKPHFQLHAAGACLNDFEPGAWAFLLIHPKSGAKVRRSGAIFNSTTFQRAQMLAVVEGLERVPRKSQIEVFSPIGEELAARLPKWKKHRYAIENEDLWARLEKLCKDHTVTVNKRLDGEKTKRVMVLADEIAISLSWRWGLPVLPKTQMDFPEEKQPLEVFLKKFEDMKRRREELKLNQRFYVLQTREKDFVCDVMTDGKLSSCGPHFCFTKDPEKARVFRYDELFGTSDLATQFAKGFSGGQSRRIQLHERI